MTTRPDADWADDAACAGHPTPNIFFPSKAVDTTKEAEAVCRHCPVTLECATYGEHIGAHHGVWGGACWGRDDEAAAERQLGRADTRTRNARRN